MIILRGDKVVYIEVDSKMPKTPGYDFLKSRKYVVKTIKMCGQVSQGLILPLAVLPSGEYKVGDDVTEILGVTKHDPEAEQENAIVSENKKKSRKPIIKFLMRFEWFRNIYLKPSVKDIFPNWIKKTDEERIQNMTRLFEKLKRDKTVLSVTEKVDGTSATFFLKKVGKNKYEFGVCSRNKRLVTEDNSYYWNVARKFKIKETLQTLIGGLDWIVLQGEITGEKIQGNKYPMDGGERFWAFNLISPEGKLTTEEMQRTPCIMEYTQCRFLMTNLLSRKIGKSQIWYIMYKGNLKFILEKEKAVYLEMLSKALALNALTQNS